MAVVGIGERVKRLGAALCLMLLVVVTNTPSVSIAAPPTFAQYHSPSTIGVGSATRLVFTIDNSFQSTPVGSLSFVDNLPAGVTVASSPDVENTCGGIVDAPAGGAAISLTDGVIGGGQRCTISVFVTSSTPGAATNTTSDLTSTEGNAGPTTSTLTVATNRPGVERSFSPSTVAFGERSTMTFTVDNSASSSFSSAFPFLDRLPPGIVVADPERVVTSCGVVTTAPGTSTVETGTSLVTAGSSCSVSVDVVANAVGVHDVIGSEYSASGGSSGFAVAPLTVVGDDLIVVQDVLDDPAEESGTATVRYSVLNRSRSTDVGAVGFTVDLDAALSGLVATGLPISDPCGPGSQVSGTSVVTVSGAALAAGERCEFDIEVAVPAGAVGDHVIATSAITSDAGSFSAAGDLLSVGRAPSLTFDFVEEPVGAGSQVTLRYTIANDRTDAAATDIAFIHPFDMFADTMSPLIPSDPCGSGSLMYSTVNAGTPHVQLLNGVLAAGASCTFDVLIDVSDDAPSGIWPSSTSRLTATVAGSVLSSREASDDLHTIAAPSLRKSFSTGPHLPGDSVTIEYSLASTGAAPDEDLSAEGAVTAISFTDDLDAALAGLAATGLPLNDVCGTGSQVTGTSVLTVTGANLAPGTACTFTVDAQVPAGASSGAFVSTTSAVMADVGGVITTGAPATDELEVYELVATKSFIDDPVTTGGSATLRFTVENLGSSDATDIFFTDNLGLMAPGIAATTAPQPDVCGAGSQMTGTNFLIFVGGNLLAGESCTFDVDVAIPASVASGSYTNTTSSVTATVDGTTATLAPMSDVLVVERPLPVLLSAEVTDDPVLAGDTATLEFTIENPNASDVMSSIEFTADLDEALAGMVASGLPLVNPCGAGSTVSGSSEIVVSGASLAGGASCSFSVTLQIPPAVASGRSSIVTSAPDASVGGFPTTGNVATADFVVADPGDVTVTIDQASGQADLSNVEPVFFDVVFSGSVTDFSGDDVELSGTALPTTAVVSGSGTTYSVAVSGMSTAGTVIADIDGGRVRADSPVNATNSPSTSTDNVIDFDGDAPTVTIEQATAQADPTNSDSFVFDVVFSEPVSGFTGTDVTVGGTSGAATVAVAGTSPGTDFTVTVSGATSDGTVVASIGAGAVADNAGNTSDASTSTDNSVTYDATGPTVTIEQATAQADPTNVDGFVFDVEFSEPVSGFTNADVTVGGTAGAATVAVAGTSPGTDFTVTVSGATGDGTIIPTVRAGAVADSLGNPSAASTSSDNTVTYDATSPTVTIDQAASQRDPVNVEPFVFDVVFSEPVTGFTGTDVVIGGTAGATTAVVSGSGAAYTVSVSGTANDGTVTATIVSAAVTDPTGNPSVASTSTDNQITYDTSLASVTVEQAAGQSDPTATDGVAFDVVFSEPVTGFDASDVVVSGAGGASVAVSGSGAAYVATVTGLAGEGTVSASVPAGAAATAAGGTNVDSVSVDASVSYDFVGPTIVTPDSPLVVANDPGKAGAVVTFVVTATDGPSGSTLDASLDVAALDVAALSVAALDVAVTCDPVSGSFFSVGTTTVTCTASDELGNDSVASFDVTVTDEEAPTIAEVPDVQATAAGAGGTVIVTYDLPAGSDVAGAASVECVPPSGSAFPIGDTTVTCTATDDAGNTSTTTFVVSVVSVELPATGGGLGLTRPALGVLLIGLGLFVASRSRRLRVS
jgi:HYR domain